MSPMARAIHPPEVKTRALELYAEHGPADTSRLLATEGHDVSSALVRKWASRAGIGTVTAERTAAARNAARLRWEQRRAEMVHECGEVAHKALRLMDEALDDGRMRDAQALVAPFGVMVDKAQLLSGAATARTEHVEPIKAAEEVLDELAQRRQRAA